MIWVGISLDGHTDRMIEPIDGVSGPLLHLGDSS